MTLLLIPLDHSLPALQVYLETQDDPALAADLLMRCLKTCEALVTFALLVGGKPSRQ